MGYAGLIIMPSHFPISVPYYQETKEFLMHKNLFLYMIKALSGQGGQRLSHALTPITNGLSRELILELDGDFNLTLKPVLY